MTTLATWILILLVYWLGMAVVTMTIQDKLDSAEATPGRIFSAIVLWPLTTIIAIQILCKDIAGRRKLE